MKNLPIVTIAIPLRNREWCIERVLEAIIRDEYPKKRTRFVFVDDSTDKTFELLLNFKHKYAEQYAEIVVLRQSSNIPQGRNICIDHSINSDFILFLDSDVVVQGTNTIRRLLEPFVDESVGMVFIPYLFFDNIALHEKIWALKEKPIQYAQECGMGLTMIRHSIIPQVGMFDESYFTAEDLEFSSRVIEKGYKIIKLSEDPAEHLQVKPHNYFHSLLLKMTPLRWRSIKKTKPKRYILRLIAYSLLIVNAFLVPFFLPWSLIPFLVLLGMLYAFHFIRMRTFFGRLVGPPFFILSGIVFAVGIYRAMLIDLKDQIIKKDVS